MLGSVTSSNDLGAIPCAISWLYKGINEKRQKSGARFSVRVSALGINATKPGSSAKDLLAALATGNYLNVRTLSLSLSISPYYINEPSFRRRRRIGVCVLLFRSEGREKVPEPQEPH
jgi:hypothetical protein